MVYYAVLGMAFGMAVSMAIDMAFGMAIGMAYSHHGLLCSLGHGIGTLASIETL
jgi:hypothetical protein